MKLRILLTLGLFICASASIATDKVAYQQALQSVTSGNVQVESIKDTPIDGLKVLTVSTGKRREIIYMSTDGRYIFNGNLFDIKNRIDVTETQKNDLRIAHLRQFNNSQRINYFPDNMDYQVSVFTDVDCPYCRQLHQQMDAYNNLGIGISYLFFPRSGLNTESSLKAVSVWCADDRKKALDSAMADGELSQLQCDNPVSDHYNAGIAEGVSGTPAWVLEDGTLIPGLLPPKQLKQQLDKMANKRPSE